MAEEVVKRRSPWLYVGLGCLAAVVLFCGGGTALIAAGVWKAKDFSDEMNDPARRESKARKAAIATLGAVPEGYSAAFSIGMPIVFETVIFVDAPLLPDGGVPAYTHVLRYWRFMDTDNTRQLKAYFESTDGGVTFQSQNLQVDTKTELARGTFMHQDHKVYWVANRGNVRTDGQLDMQEGLVTLMYFDCPGDQVRIATWEMKEPQGGAEDLQGTVADPKEMQKLLTPLSPCGK